MLLVRLCVYEWTIHRFKQSTMYSTHISDEFYSTEMPYTPVYCFMRKQFNALVIFFNTQCCEFVYMYLFTILCTNQKAIEQKREQ